MLGRRRGLCSTRQVSRPPLKAARLSHRQTATARRQLRVYVTTAPLPPSLAESNPDSRASFGGRLVAVLARPLVRPPWLH